MSAEPEGYRLGSADCRALPETTLILLRIRWSPTLLNVAFSYPACMLVVMSERGRQIVLRTPRLAIRQFTVDDVDNLFNLNSDLEVMRYLGRSASREVLRNEIIPFHLGAYQRFDRLGTWAAESASTGEFLGWFHFRAEDGDITNIDLGYRLRREAWNKGYGTEGSAARINMGFTGLGVQRVFAHVMVANAAPRRVLEKCGLTLVRTIPHRGPDADVIDGAGQAEAEYALTKPEWEAHTGSRTQ
jgi:RimJ/RimL family protein N-acetyltransferase